MFLLGFILCWALCTSWTLVTIFFSEDYFPPNRVLNYNLFKYFLRHFLLLIFFWDSYNSNVGAFSVVQEISETVLISFHSFFIISTILSFSSLIHSSISCILLLIPSSVLSISVVVFFTYCSLILLDSC